MPNFYDAVYTVVRDIPPGRVMTYGQIAAILGAPRAARAVGYAMRASAHSDVPWQRVINGQGEISGKGGGDRPLLQRSLLEAEGVVFDAHDACDLMHYRWEPPNADVYRYEGDFDLNEVPFR